ncbi:DUF4158 domain-containing protein [Streptomyces griseofuscus]|uniref:DUF4158 domain-containing protein n=1 Tax=Streptomyces griseofuscus TaxID=146922 RepID=UPI003453F11C
MEARFPEDAGETPGPTVSYVAQQVEVPAEEWAAYDWAGRAIKRHRMEIRGAFGFRECTEEDLAGRSRRSGSPTPTGVPCPRCSGPT